MLDGYAPTKAETKAIDDAWHILCDLPRGNREIARLTTHEQRGYGRASDRVLRAAARALMVKWFLDGVSRPDELLRACYWIRPAAIYAQGFGAEWIMAAVPGQATATNQILATMCAGVAAHEAAFKRMPDADNAALAAAFPDQYKTEA
jgi:hypothetical protein